MFSFGGAALAPTAVFENSIARQRFETCDEASCIGSRRGPSGPLLGPTWTMTVVSAWSRSPSGVCSPLRGHAYVTEVTLEVLSLLPSQAAQSGHLARWWASALPGVKEKRSVAMKMATNRTLKAL